tara:strand:- start:83 stop:688 length:606 start_codon:yes stop_codon:yes gene_type:complete
MTGIVKTDQIQGAQGTTVTVPTGNTLAVTSNATVGGTLGVTGASTLSGGITNAGTITAGTVGSSVVFPAGHVIQTVTNTSTSTVNSSSSSASDLITASISPKFSNSVIHIEGYVSRMQVVYGSSNAYASLYITDPAGNNLTTAVLGSAIANSSPMAVFATHSPASTSSQTYKIRLSTSSGGTTSTGTDGQRYTIKLTEVAQ